MKATNSSKTTPKTEQKPKKSAIELYEGTNKRLTIMIIIMSVWTVFLILGSIFLGFTAYLGAKEIYVDLIELKDESSSLYQSIKEDIKSEFSAELKSAIEESINSSSSSATSSSSSALESYKQLLSR